MAYQGGLRVPAYAAAKHAINGLVQALCNEWAPHGINVNALAQAISPPGWGWRCSMTVRGPQVLARIPAGALATPPSWWGPRCFLASKASAYMHGQVLVIDGGWLAR